MPKLPIDLSLSENPSINADPISENEKASSGKSKRTTKTFQEMLKKIKKEESIRKKRMLAEKKKYQKIEQEELLERERLRQEKEEERRKYFEQLEQTLSKVSFHSFINNNHF